VIALYGKNNTVIPDLEEIDLTPTSFDKVALPNVESGTVRVIDQLGRAVRVETLPRMQMDLSNLPNGLYFVEIKTEDKTMVGKIWKQ